MSTKKLRTLLEVIQNNSEELSENSDKKLNSKEFWIQHEKIQDELFEQHKKEQDSIKMSWEKFNKPFTI